MEIEGYTLATNSQAVCEVGDIILQKSNVFDLAEARNLCENTTGCSHFTLSTVAGTDGLPDTMRNSLWLCRGEPRVVHHFGWLTSASEARAPKLAFSSDADPTGVVLWDGPLL